MMLGRASFSLLVTDVTFVVKPFMSMCVREGVVTHNSEVQSQVCVQEGIMGVGSL